MKQILLMIAVVALVGCGKKEPVQPTATKPEATKPEPTKGINQTSKVKIGTPIWEFETGDDVSSSPAIGSDGTVYVGSFDKNLYAIRTLYRTIQIAKHKIINFSEQLGQVLSKFIQDIASLAKEMCEGLTVLAVAHAPADFLWMINVAFQRPAPAA